MANDEREWNTQELQQDFEVEGFGYGLVVVRRKSDQVLGSMDFTKDIGTPRKYFNFVPHEKG